jgi:hypothetical protein
VGLRQFADAAAEEPFQLIELNLSDSPIADDGVEVLSEMLDNRALCNLLTLKLEKCVHLGMVLP